jgi:hypothetical protein
MHSVLKFEQPGANMPNALISVVKERTIVNYSTHKIIRTHGPDRKGDLCQL